MFDQNNLMKLDECLACGSSNLKPVLDLGSQPLANSFKNTKDEVQPSYPLAINLCKDCCHVQLTHAVDPAIIYTNYLYVSGTSATMREHFKWFADMSVEYYKSRNSKEPVNAFDIGCNDGSQLDQYKQLGIDTYGIDPATNLYDRAAANHHVWNRFFDMQFISRHVEDANEGDVPEKHDIIVAQNVFAHNPEPTHFLMAARNLMHDDSLLFIQVSQADMIKNNEFDTIYHEHISFYNVNSMNELCKRMGMQLVDVIKCPLHGGSNIFVLSTNMTRAGFDLETALNMEETAGLYDEATYENYANKCNRLVKTLRDTVAPYQSLNVGYWIIGYGAAAKGMTLLNYSGIRPDFIVDDNPLKQGKFTPGSSVEIVSIDKLDEFKDPVLFIPLAWNFFEEIKTKIKSKRTNQYDQFLTYFPEVEVKS